MYRIRIPIGIALILTIVLLGYTDHRTNTAYATSGALAFVLLAALWEFYAMVQKRGYNPYTYFSLVFSFIMVLWTIFPIWNIEIGGILLLCICIRFLFDTHKENALENFAMTMLGFVYVTYLLSYALKIRSFGSELNQNTNGLYYLIFLVLVAKGMDIGGYMVGKAFGKHKIFPSISPKKSYEGAVGGILCSIGIGWIFYTYVPLINTTLTMTKVVIFACIMSVLSLLGDFVESLIKRRCDVKDSSKLIPEFGGILDLVDSLLLAAPAAYYFLLIFAT